MTVNTKMKAIADEVRDLTGATSTLTLDAMASNLSDANDEVSSQADLIAEIVSALESKVAGSEPELQEKTITPTTSSQSVTPDTGYDGLSKVTVNAMPTATQATPSISVDSAGKITASVTQSAGYVSAGTKSATKQLTTQSAKTITPSTSTQTAVASGRYTTGAVTVKGDTNLVAENIKSGVSIFGVNGSYEGSGGSGSGGGSVETYTGTIYKQRGVLGGGSIATAFYTNGEMVVCATQISSGSEEQITVAAGTVIVVSSGISDSSTNVTFLNDETFGTIGATPTADNFIINTY